MAEWKATASGPVIFEYREGSKVLSSFWHDQVAGFYCDPKGFPLSRVFREAQEIIEKRVAGIEDKGKQGRLAL